MKNKIILILALLVGLAAALGIYLYLDNLKNTYREQGDFVKVVTARQRIPARTEVTPQMIETKDIPAQYINERAAVDASEVVGKIVRSDIMPGEQVLRDKLANDWDASEGLSYLVQPGKRAVTIAVNEVSSVAGQIMPGDRIDVVGTFDLQGAVTTVIIQNVDVLSIDQTTDPNTVKTREGGKAALPTSITLSVTPEQMQPLIISSEKGSLRLALRSASDHEPINLPATKLTQIVPQ